jgi:hypothetical protein
VAMVGIPEPSIEDCPGCGEHSLEVVRNHIYAGNGTLLRTTVKSKKCLNGSCPSRSRSTR